MSGCQNCGAKKGCTHRKDEMFAAIDQVLASLYPTRTWGEPDDQVRFGAGIEEDEGQSLAEELARELDAATFYRAGDAEEYCDYIYILCMGREPCLVQLRDGEVPVPEELVSDPAGQVSDPISELYLRVCLSQLTRMVGVQQVAMNLERVDGDYLVHERPRAGVYDAPLLRRMQRLVAILPAYDLIHLDFGEISAPPEGYRPGVYESLYGQLPDTANYLFFAQPSTMRSTCFFPTPGR